jgi:polysaccharide pyruvyl transferase WcaK-like protein
MTLVNIFVVGNYGNKNIGDEVLLKGVIKKNADWQKNKFFVPVRDADFVDIYHNDMKGVIHPILISNRFCLIKFFVKCRIVIIGGGGLWGNYMGKLAHFIPLAAILGKIMLKQVYFEAIGLYSSAPNFDKFFANLGILFSNSCTVRDNESFKNLWKINRKKSKIVSDLSIYVLRDHSLDWNIIPDVTEQYLITNMKQRKKVLIGLSLMRIRDHNTRKRIIIELSKAFNLLNDKYENSFVVIFFPFSNAGTISPDIKLAEEIIKNLVNKDNFIILTHTNPLSWYKLIRDFINIFIGMRYHSVIFASEANKPVLCLPYENKVTEYLKTDKGKKIQSIKMETIDFHQIISFVETSGLLN